MALAITAVFAGPALAQECKQGEYCLTVPLPGQPRSFSDPATYVATIYKFSIGIAGLLALAIIVYGGIQYTASAGNPSLQGESKDMIRQAIFGVILLLSAYLILRTINPELVQLKAPSLEKVSLSKTGIFSDLAAQAAAKRWQAVNDLEKAKASFAQNPSLENEYQAVQAEIKLLQSQQTIISNITENERKTLSELGSGYIRQQPAEQLRQQITKGERQISELGLKINELGRRGIELQKQIQEEQARLEKEFLEQHTD